jgi:hypothetical protein
MTNHHHDSDSTTAARMKRVEAAVIAAGLTTEAELDRVLEVLEGTASPRNGASIPARPGSTPPSPTLSSLTPTPPSRNWNCQRRPDPHILRGRRRPNGTCPP